MTVTIVRSSSRRHAQCTMVRRNKRKPQQRKPELQTSPELYLNRELSMLAFNERVLAMATRAVRSAGGAAALRLHRLVQPRRILRGAHLGPERGNPRDPRRLATGGRLRRDHAAGPSRWCSGSTRCSTRRSEPALERRNIVVLESRPAQRGATDLGARVFHARSEATAVADRARSVASLPAGAQQVAQLHPAARQARTRSAALRRSRFSRCRACCRA